MAFDADALLAHLQPESIRLVLSTAGLSLVAKEMIEACVVTPVKGFFAGEFTKDLEPVASERYSTHVLAGYRYETDACLAWLVDQQVLTKAEAETVARVRELRNVLGHNLTGLVLDPNFAADYQALSDFAAVLRRLGIFWGRVMVDTDDAYDGQDISDDDIDSGMSILYRVLLQAFEDGMPGDQVDTDSSPGTSAPPDCRAATASQ